MKRFIALAFLVLSVAALTLANTVAAVAPGNNGTVKIEDSVNPKPEPANDPHVCQFDLKFYFADAEQTGDWFIKSWPPTGNKTTVLSGDYATNSAGFDRQPPTGYYSLPNGHYKLFWKGDEAKLWKHKVFWVDCPASSESASVPPSDSASIPASAVPSGSELAASGTPPGVDTGGGAPPPTDTDSPVAVVGANYALLIVVAGLLVLVFTAPRRRRR